jgi:hypothetical protein
VTQASWTLPKACLRILRRPLLVGSLAAVTSLPDTGLHAQGVTTVAIGGTVRTPGALLSPLERYVIDEDGTFGLQYTNASWGFFEYTGTYARAGASIGFYFDASRA